VPFSNSPTCLSGTRLRPLARADAHRRRSKRREQKFKSPKHELAALRGKPTKLAVPLTGQKQTASATKLNTRSSITAMIGGKENSNLSPRRQLVLENGESAPLEQKAITTESRYARTRFLGRCKSGGVRWQCRPNNADADLDHMKVFEHEIEEILSEPNNTPITPTSPEEVCEIIGSLKAKKAPGPDHIPNTALKLMPEQAVVALTAIINASLRLCHFPSRWKRANVIFIP
jgi:hypothetical protein